MTSQLSVDTQKHFICVSDMLIEQITPKQMFAFIAESIITQVANSRYLRSHSFFTSLWYIISNILTSLDWSSMQDRRKSHRLSCLHIMINGKLYIKYHIQPKPTRARRGHNSQFQPTHARTDAFANSFFMRTARTRDCHPH